MGKTKKTVVDDHAPPAYVAKMMARKLYKWAEGYDYDASWRSLSAEQQSDFVKNARDASPPRKSDKVEKEQTSNKKKKDPNMPKNPRTGYIWFNQTKDPKILKRLKNIPEGVKAKNHRINIWNELTESEKAPYLKMAVDDKERYNKQMELFKDGKFNRTEADKAEAQEKTEIAEKAEKKAQKEEKKKDDKKKKKKSSSSSEESDSDSE